MVFPSGYITFSPIRLLRSGYMIFPSFRFLLHEWLLPFPPVTRYEGKDGRHSVRRSVQRSRASSQV